MITHIDKNTLRGQSLKNEAQFKDLATQINQTFNSTIQFTKTYSESAYYIVENAISFVQDSTNNYNPSNIKNKAIMFMGPSGAGKSTLMNYLSGVPMIIKDDIDRIALIPKDPTQSIALVGAGGGSTTFLPNLYSPTNIEGFNDTTFIDCPGDFDTNGGLFEILNEITKEKIGNLTKNLKIVLVFPQASLTSEGSYGKIFYETLKKMQKMIGNVISLIDNIFLVVSQARPNDNAPTQVEATLKSLLNNTNNGLGEFQQILQTIVSNKRFALMTRPSNSDIDGDDYNPPLFGQRETILKSITDVSFFDSSNGPNLFSATASNGVYDMVDGINSSIGAAQIIATRLMNYFKSYFTKVSNTKLAINFQDNNIIELFSQLSLLPDTGISFVSFVRSLVEKIAQISILPPISTESVDYLLEVLSFLWKFSRNNGKVNLGNSSLKASFGISEVFIGKLFQETLSIKETIFTPSSDQKKLVVQGQKLRFSEVLVRYAKEMNDLTIIAFKEFIFDRDFTDAGDNIAIFAPIWTVEKPVTINLSGKKGDTQSSDNYDTNTGQGIQGNSGTSGGHFYGVGETFNNIDRLTIISNGGNGGNGSNGKEGTSDDSVIPIIDNDSFEYGNGDKGDKELQGLLKKIGKSTKNFIHFIRDFYDQDYPNIPRVFKGIDYLYFFHKWFFAATKIEDLTIKIEYDSSKTRKGDKATHNEFDYIDLYCTVKLRRPGREGKMGGAGGFGGKAGSANIFKWDKTNITPLNNFIKKLGDGTVGQAGNNGISGKTTHLEKNVILAGHLYLGEDRPCDIRCEIRNDNSRVAPVISKERVSYPDNKQRNITNTAPLQVESNFISSRQDFIQTIISRNASFKNIDILDTPFLQWVINKPSTFDLKELMSRLISLEKNYSDNVSMEILQFYYKLKDDVDAFCLQAKTEAQKGSPPKNTIPDEMVTTLKYVYQLICSSIFRFKTYRQSSCVVLKMDEYIKVINRNIEALQTIEKANVVNMYKQQYEANIQSKITEAENFVNELENNITECENQLKTDTQALISESFGNIDKLGDQNKQLEEDKKKLKENMNTRIALMAISGALAIGGAFLGPAGGMAAGLIGQTMTTVGEMAIKDPDARGSTFRNITSIDQGLANKWGTYIKSTSTDSDKLAALEAKVYMNKEYRPQSEYKPPDHSKNLTATQRIELLNREENFNILKDEEKIMLKQVEKRNNTSQSRINQLDSEIAVLAKKIPNFEPYKIEAAFTAINTGLRIGREVQITQDKMKQIEQMIEENKKFMILIEKNIYEMQQFQNQQLQDMADYLNKINYAEKTSVGLFVTRFQTGKYLDLINEFIDVMQENSTGVNIKRTFTILKQALESIVALYEKIQAYVEQQEFAGFISNSLNAGDPLQNISKDIRPSLETIINLSNRNLLLDQFNKAKIGFTQWSFPFSTNYFESANFSDLTTKAMDYSQDPTKYKSNLSTQVKTKINNILDVIQTFNSTITTGAEISRDLSVMTQVAFDKSSPYGPFYQWNYADHVVSFKKLLRGEEITLVSNAELAMYNVTKFNSIFLSISIDDNEAENTRLQSLLNQFQIKMTHSGISSFKLNNNIFSINATGSLPQSGSTSENPLSLILTMNDPKKGFNILADKLGNNVAILSPYTIWKFKLNPIRDSTLLSQLSKFENINLTLNGIGTYLLPGTTQKMNEFTQKVKDDFSGSVSIIKL